MKTYILTFGKYKGWKFRDTPPVYQEWFLANVKPLPKELKDDEMERFGPKSHRHTPFDTKKPF
jgi:hypothetical protein